MEVKDLSNSQLLTERELTKSNISKLREQRRGLDGQLDTEYFRKNEIEEEIAKRFKEDL